MKKSIFLAISIVILTSCAGKKALYTWDKYEVSSYNYLKNSNEKSTQELIKTYQRIIKKQKGTRRVVPPGIYADYGYLLIQANQTEEGTAMLLKEIELYPESQVFIDRIIKMTEK
ncbi:MAG: DUF4810 domain-containing protein [Aequorivita sp.]